jgi:hypothetical protein
MVTEETRRMGRRTAQTPDHILQLFDTPDSLANVVSAFLNEGWEAGEHLLVVAKPRHWNRIADRLQRRGCTEAEAIEQGRLTVLDAQPTLAAFMRGQVVDADRFRATIGALVARLAHRSTNAGLRIYGELVELLAEEGNVDGARQVELLWNELRQQHRFTLLCGYSAAHFAGLGMAPALRAICDCHNRVQRNASDLLGSWLLTDERAEAADAG